MNPIILVVPIITTIIFVGAWLYEYSERKDEQKEAKYWKGMYGAVCKKEESANEIIMEQDKSNVKLRDQLSTADKAYDLLVKELEDTKTKLNEANEIAKYFSLDNDKVRDAYLDLIAMPRRKRDALVRELRAKV